MKQECKREIIFCSQQIRIAVGGCRRDLCELFRLGVSFLRCGGRWVCAEALRTGTMVHVGVVGAGAVGAFVGARLLAGNTGEGALADLKVTLVGRQSLIDCFRGNGNVLVTHTSNGEVSRHPASKEFVVSDQIADVADADIILVAVKGAHTEDVAHSLRKVLPKGVPKTIFSLQNGVANAHILSSIIADKNVTVLPASVVFNVVWSGADFAQRTPGEIFIQDGPHAALFARLARRGSIPIQVEPDLTAVQYGKLLINLNNAVNALGGIPIVATFKDPHLRKVVSMCIYEAIDVFDRAGIPMKSPKRDASIRVWPRLFGLPDPLFNAIFDIVIKMHPAAKTSMLQDLERGRLTEIDLLNGEVVRVAKEHGFEEPKVNAILVKLIKEAEANGGTPMMPGPELYDLVTK